MNDLNIDRMNRVAAEAIQAGIEARLDKKPEGEINLHFLCAMAMGTVALSTAIARLLPEVSSQLEKLNRNLEKLEK